MKVNELNTTSKSNRKRVGRGISSGHGKTSGRGTKGQNSRTGGGVRPGFEGGQNPVIHRIPKLKGFNPRPNNTEIIYTSDLNKFKASETVDNLKLQETGAINSQFSVVKIVLKGKLEKSLKVNLQKITKGALSEITKAGGEFKETPVPKRQSTKKQ